MKLIALNDFVCLFSQRVKPKRPPHMLTTTSWDKGLNNMKVNVTKCRYEVLTLPMSANHISIPTWGKAVSWNRNGLVQ